MATTKAQQKAVNKYVREKYDRVLVTFGRKGKKDIIRAHADARGESVNGFIGRAINEAMQHDSSQEAAGTPTHPPTAVLLPPHTIKAAQEAAEATGESVSAFVTRAVDSQVKRDTAARRMGINQVTSEQAGGKAHAD